MHCHDRNKVNIISDPKKETLDVLQKLGKVVVPYNCIWFITKIEFTDRYNDKTFVYENYVL